MAIWLFVNQLNTFMIISYTSTDWLEVSHPGCWCQLALPVGSRPYTPWQDRCPSLSLARASCGWSRDGRNPRRMIDSGVSFPPLRTPSHSRDRPDGERRIQWWKERHDNSLVQALSEQFVQRCQTSVCFVSEFLKGITAVILVFWTVLQFSSSYSQWSLCWVSNMAVPPDQWARQWQLWWGRCCTLTLTGSCSSSHPVPSGPRFDGTLETCPTERMRRDEKMHKLKQEVHIVYIKWEKRRREEHQTVGEIRLIERLINSQPVDDSTWEQW